MNKINQFISPIKMPSTDDDPPASTKHVVATAADYRSSSSYSFDDDISASIVPSPIVSNQSLNDDGNDEIVDVATDKRNAIDDRGAELTSVLKHASTNATATPTISSQDEVDARRIYALTLLCGMSIHVWQPVAPFVLKELGGGEREWAAFTSLTSLVYMFGALLVGQLIDKYGARRLLVAGFVAGFISTSTCYRAQTWSWLFASRAPLMFHQILVACRSIIASRYNSDLTRLSNLSVAYGMGVTLGPLLGSAVVWLTAGQVRTNLLVSSAISAAGLVVVASLCAGASSPPTKSRRSSLKTVNARDLWELARMPTVRPVLGVKVLIGFASSILHSKLSFILTEDLHISPTQIGLVYAYLGVMSVMFQTFVSRVNLVARIGERWTMLLGLSMNGLALFQISQSQSIMLWVSLFTILNTVLFNLTASLLTRAVQISSHGSIVGLEMGLLNAVRIIGPLVGVYAPQPLMVAAVATTTAMVMLIE